MCGIVGYVGKKDCTKVLLDSLSKLEYRGYDSAGIAVFENDAIKTKKTKGRLADLEEKLKREGWLNGTCGIGHTRWATHGEPSDINSHPHGNANISIVHNGIIENYRTIKDFLLKKGYVFESQTDTETVAKLLDYYYEGDPIDAIIKTLKDVTGANLDLILNNFRYLAKHCPNKVIVRMPVIPRFNDDICEEVIKFCAVLKLAEVNLLPFHTMGKNKWNQMQKKFKYDQDSMMDRDILNPYMDIGKKWGVKVKIGG